MLGRDSRSTLALRARRQRNRLFGNTTFAALFQHPQAGAQFGAVGYLAAASDHLAATSECSGKAVTAPLPERV